MLTNESAFIYENGMLKIGGSGSAVSRNPLSKHELFLSRFCYLICKGVHSAYISFTSWINVTLRGTEVLLLCYWNTVLAVEEEAVLN